MADLLRTGVDAQGRLARREQHRVVVADAVDRPCAEARHETDEAVLAPEPRGPAELIAAESDARVGRHQVGSGARADDLLDHDAHLLVEVEQAVLGAVEDRVGGEDRGVDFSDGVEQRLEAHLLGALVGQEEALVFAREGRAQSVFEQTGAAHDQRPLAEVIERQREAPHEIGGEPRMLEELDDIGVLDADLLEFLVFLLVDILEVVVAQELGQAVGRQIPGLRGADTAQERLVFGCAAQQVRGEEQAGALAAESAVAAARKDDARSEVEEIRDFQMALGEVDERDVVGEEAPDQGDEQPFLRRRRKGGATVGQGVVALDGVDNLAEWGVGRIDGLDQEAEPVLLDPLLQASQDLLVAQVACGDGEDLVAHGEDRLARLLLAGAVAVGRALGRGQGEVGAEGAEHVPRLLHPAPEKVVEHLARRVEEELLVGTPQQVEDHHPLVTGLRGGRLLGRLALAQQRRQSAAGHGLADTFRDGADQLPLLLQEESLACLRHRAGVGDGKRADRLGAGAHRHGLGPLRLAVAGGLVDRALADEARLAELRVLPAAGERGDEILEDVGQRTVGPGQQCLDLVEALELLRPLAQDLELVAGSPAVGHASAPRIRATPSRAAAPPGPRG